MRRLAVRLIQSASIVIGVAAVVAGLLMMSSCGAAAGFGGFLVVLLVAAVIVSAFFLLVQTSNDVSRIRERLETGVANLTPPEPESATPGDSPPPTSETPSAPR